MPSAISGLAPAGARIGRGDRHSVHRVAKDVIAEGQISHPAGRTRAVLVLRIKQDCGAFLRLRPVIFKDVSLDQFPNRVLGLIEVLHCKLSTEEAGMLMPPGERLKYVIVAKLNIGQGAIGARPAPEYIFARRLEKVINDLDRPNPAHRADGRGVSSVGGSFGMDVRNKRVDNGNVGAGFEDHSLHVLAGWRAVDPATIENNMASI